MSKKIYVGGLSWDTRENDLRTAFDRFGSIEVVRVITDRETGRSRGFAFITFEDSVAADDAVREMDGAMLGSRNIKVNQAREKNRRGGRGSDRQGNRW